MSPSAASYPSPPASPSPATGIDASTEHTPSISAEGASENNDTLSARLDALLESYLGLLDTYTTLRAQLSKAFSSGFLALAQANRTSTLGPGRRYGEEGFDERMKAFKRVRIGFKSELDAEAHGKGSLHGLSPVVPIDQGSEDRQAHENNHNLVSKPVEDAEQTTDTIENTQTRQDREYSGLQHQTGPASSPTHLPSHHPASAATCASASASGSAPSPSYSYTITSAYAPTADDTDTGPSAKSQSRPRDPLKWYGILTPPGLRQCQAHFTNSITSTIPDLLSMASSLASHEESIWELRRQLGIMDDYPESDTPHPSQSPLQGAPAQDRLVDKFNFTVQTQAAPAMSPEGIPTSDRRHEQKRAPSAKAFKGKTKSTPPLPSSAGVGGSGTASGLSMPVRAQVASEPRSRVLKLE